jgi:hypothetical protein
MRAPVVQTDQIVPDYLCKQPATPLYINLRLIKIKWIN